MADRIFEKSFKSWKLACIDFRGYLRTKLE